MAEIKLPGVGMTFGFHNEPDEFRFIPDAYFRSAMLCSVEIVVNSTYKELSIGFPFLVGKKLMMHKLRMPFRAITGVWRASGTRGDQSLIFSTSEPPQIFIAEDDLSSRRPHYEPKRILVRLTGLQQSNHNLPLTSFPYDTNIPIDIGQWRLYKVDFEASILCAAQAREVMAVLQQHNLSPSEMGSIKMLYRPSKNLRRLETNTDEPLSEVKSISQLVKQLPFEARYQLEVCLTQDIIHPNNLSGAFMRTLSRLSEIEAVSRLDKMAEKQARVWDPASAILKSVPIAHLYRKHPEYCTMIRSITITPTTIYVNTPAIEVSNRVLRSYAHVANRFLRVKFADEKSCGKLKGSGLQSSEMIFDRITQCMTHGVIVAGVTYEYLASGNSQFREQGAFFFASDDDLKASTIRTHLGDFSDNLTVAKYAARIGQCFSTSRSITAIEPLVVETDDISRNGCIFTDGAGKISLELASTISREMNLPGGEPAPPSAYQFRLGGFKGVVAIDPSTHGTGIHLRESQYKFHSNAAKLEVIRISNFRTATLNRQLVLCLKSLGIPDQIFEDMLQDQIRNFAKAVTEPEVALRELQRRVDPNLVTLQLAHMIEAGLMQAQEPFVLSLIKLWRAWSLQSLKEKATLVIDEGAFLLGCTDERQVLKGYFRPSVELDGLPLERLKKLLPEVFVQIQHPADGGTCRIITGLCIVARNPSLHHGDVRVVMAVDKPELHHLRDVVVFAQTGDRDVPSMCSGGDLDGDDFIISWDPKLIPPRDSWFECPMDDTGPQTIAPTRVYGPRVQQQIIEFFVNYIRQDTLGLIATQWLANADLHDSVRHEHCQQLARLHSLAVDFPKSGIPARLDRNLAPASYPHFLSAKGTRKNVHTSTNILGRLYDAVEGQTFTPVHEMPFDSVLLDACSVPDHYLLKARELKREYDAAMKRIMMQFEIHTEFEVWSTFVLQHTKLCNAYMLREDLGRLVDALKDQYTSAIKDFLKEPSAASELAISSDALTAFAVSMYRVSATDVADFLSTRDNGNTAQTPPMISFPWILHRELCCLSRTTRLASRLGLVAASRANKSEPSSSPAAQSLGATMSSIEPSTKSEQGDNEISEDRMSICSEDDRNPLSPRSYTCNNPGIVERLESPLNLMDLDDRLRPESLPAMQPSRISQPCIKGNPSSWTGSAHLNPGNGKQPPQHKTVNLAATHTQARRMASMSESLLVDFDSDSNDDDRDSKDEHGNPLPPPPPSGPPRSFY